jgi:hypothetical protein
MSLDYVCDGLVYLQRKRLFCIKSQSRCDRSIESFIATLLGFKTDLDETGRKKLFNQAKAIRQKIEKAGTDFDYGQWGEQIEGVCAMIIKSAETRANWDKQRKEIEDEMRGFAKMLPAYPFVQTVKGFGDLGLAALVGEAGNLSNYPTVAKLWKRFGLAVMPDGCRQGMVPKYLGREDRKAAWIERGYVGRRRAEVYAFVDDVMFRAQWRGEKESDDGVVTPPHAIGTYGEIYNRKKQEYLSREGWTPGHAENAARRYMAKCLLVDLWRAWRKGSVVDVSVDRPFIENDEISLLEAAD